MPVFSSAASRHGALPGKSSHCFQLEFKAVSSSNGSTPLWLSPPDSTTSRSNNLGKADSAWAGDPAQLNAIAFFGFYA
jgi:hypothetical protein